MKKATVAFFIGSIMLIPLVSSASILDDLQAQVNALTEVVKSLQLKLQAILIAKVLTRANTTAVSGATHHRQLLSSLQMAVRHLPKERRILFLDKEETGK